jgi:CBS domain-containing protein
MTMDSRNSLSGVVVDSAMRKQVIRLPQNISISSGINTLIKHKVNGLLTVDEDGFPVGVLSKTDIMGAYYATIPIDAPLDYIMSRPPLFCRSDDPLEAALEQMRVTGVYRLYVMEAEGESVVGSLAYPDIVGLLYQYCCKCDYSHFRKLPQRGGESIERTLVKDCMTKDLKGICQTDSIVLAMEALSANKMGAILVRDQENSPVGVISKTDLILAYKHGVDPSGQAHSIMSRPLKSCRADELLEDAIRTMIFSDLHRLFVSEEGSGDIIGVFTLTDAARNKSGSCQACVSSRITV